MVSFRIWIGGYFHMSGGIRALHVLRDELRARGLQAHMSYDSPRDESIVVYPEIVGSNPEDAEKIVRWLLNKATLPEDGLTFAWETGMGEWPLLTVDIIERHLWFPRTGPRTGVGYWVGKGGLDPSVLPAGAVEINRYNYPERAGLAEFVGSLEYLISFDPFTAVVEEAICAGTPVMVHAPANQWDKDTIQSQNWYPFGVGWGWEEMGHARDTVGLAFDHYDAMRSVFADRIDRFVESCESRFG